MFDVIVTTWGMLMAASPLLQAVRIVRRRHADDVSLPMLAIIGFGGLLWLGYGIEHGLISIIVCNVIGFLAATGTIVVAVRIRRRSHKADPPASH